ncbi:hypothetical protein [Pelagibacterium sp.]|uniref:hypothetical protein n=1 Tax=Pelagibacterium sp. TaxID=1967288 RepID=UPI003A8F7808
MALSEQSILLISGHLRPIKTIIGQLPYVLFGVGMLWLSSLSSWTDIQDFFLWLVLFMFGLAALGSSLYFVACALSGYPKIVLMDGLLISFGMMNRSLHLDLSNHGKAEVVQFGRSTQTALAFHTVQEEAVLAKAGLAHSPTSLNAAKLFPLTQSVGNDLDRAQEIADQINAYRENFTKKVDIEGLTVERILSRKMNAHLWGFLATVGAAIFVAVILKILLPG